MFDRGETLQLLKQHRAKDRLTFKLGGEIRTFGAGVKKSGGQSAGDAIMGFGAPNVIEDECYLVTDNVHSKVMRMLGDSTDNFLVKIGNPWNRGHGYKSRINDDYFKMVIDWERGLKEGRLTKEYVEEMRKEPTFPCCMNAYRLKKMRCRRVAGCLCSTEKELRNAFVREEITGWGLSDSVTT